MNSFECTRLLIHHSANVNRKDKSGSTPLHLCCAYSIPELIPLLLSSGSHLNVLDKDRKTPLDLAEEGGDSDAHLACAVLIRRHLELFQSEEISKYATRPLPWTNEINSFDPADVSSPEPQVSPSNTKQRVFPPFIAGSTMRVSQWEWKRALSEYTPTPYVPPRSSPPSSSLSPHRHTFPLFDERPKSPPALSTTLTESQSKLSDPKIHPSLSQSLMVSFPGKVPTLPSTISKQKVIPPTQPNKKVPIMLPFKPVSAQYGDVFLSVEMCGDCHLHNWSLWHNEDRYNGAANDCLRIIIHDLLRNAPKIRLFALKTKVKPQNRERIGALEVVLGVKVSSAGLNSSKGWLVHSIFSKLKTQRSRFASSFLWLILFDDLVGRRLPHSETLHRIL
jgi:hypothetical protein